MIRVRSHSLGVDDADGKRLVKTKYFKKYGVRCLLYIFLQKCFEDYIEIEEITPEEGANNG